jgi:hypothetical protein
MRTPPPVLLELALPELAFPLAVPDVALLELVLALALAFADEAVSALPVLPEVAAFWLVFALASAVFSMRIPPPVLLPELLLPELLLLELALLEALLLADALASVVPLLLALVLPWFALGSTTVRSIRIPPPVLPLPLLLAADDDVADVSALALPSVVLPTAVFE